MNRLFDLKFVIGIFFLAVGVVLIGYSFIATGRTAEAGRVNLYCGLLMGAFGGVMMLLPASKNG
jgi:hypothetical protein